PSLGRFSTEDPVLGHMGVGVSVDRYPYAWDNPLNLYDLSGRDVCGTAGEVPGIGGFLEDACHVGSYHQPGEPTTVENVEYVGERASDFLKTTKNWLSHINLDPFGHKSCEKKLISSTSPFFPCEESEGGLEYKNSEPGTFVPPVDPMGPAPSPGSLIPVPAPTSLPQPVTPFIP
ncbi:MAG TPA: hypothetical protein VFI09_04735, partial [Solirubrobacterales bacterium]|nr:hypothetical protein [Solirubrobacterales bacterium]